MTDHNKLFNLFKERTGRTTHEPHQKRRDATTLYGYQPPTTRRFAWQRTDDGE